MQMTCSPLFKCMCIAVLPGFMFLNNNNDKKPFLVANPIWSIMSEPNACSQGVVNKATKRWYVYH